LLTRHSARVLLHCRNIKKGQKALAEISAATGSDKIELVSADFEDLQSVKKMCNSIIEKYSHLDILVNNAGAIFKEYQTARGGIEKTILVNHLSGFLLTNLLLKQLEKGPESLIINMASNAHYRGKMNFASFKQNLGYTGFRAYGQSKLANLLFTYELHKRLKKSTTSTFCLHPGLVATNFAASQYFTVEFAFKMIPFFFTSPKKVARDVLKFIGDPDSAGKFFYAGKERQSSLLSYDEHLAGELWRHSEEFVSEI